MVHERDCDAILIAVLRGDALAPADDVHVAGCATCAPLAAGLAGSAARLAAPPAEPPPGLSERVLRAAAPLLASNARAARWTPHLHGRRLAAALAPAVLLFPLLVVGDVLLLRTAHAFLATLLPATLTTYLVASYAALLAALVCLAFGAIPLLVQRQTFATLDLKESHV